ncbi:MAG: hypothetical protein ACPHRO_01790 [Nannocystaceae bacterium]
MDEHAQHEQRASSRPTGAGRWVWAWLVVVLAGCTALYSTCLDVDYAADDFWQIAAIEGLFGADANALNLYVFAESNPATTQGHIVRGSLPWWTVPGWEFAMVRPLSSLTIALDHWLAPRAVWWHHVHSLFWLWAVFAMAWRWLRRVLMPGVAAAALLFFAVDDSIGVSLSWIANRCAFVSMFFSLWALDIHVRRMGWSRDGSRLADTAKTRGLELFAWLLAFMGSEYATCAVAYLAAWHLCVSRAPWRGRVMACVPALGMTLFFILMFMWLGGSASGLAEYADPIHDPVRFLRECGHKLPRLVGETWLSIGGDSKWILQRLYRWPDVAELFGDWKFMLPIRPWRHALLCGAGLPVIAALAWGCGRGLDSHERRVMWAASLGSVLSCFPLCSTVPQTRLLVFPSLGPAIALSLMVLGALRLLRRRWPGSGGLARVRRVAMPLLLMVSTSGVIGVDVILDGRRTRWLAKILQRGQASLRAHLRSPDVTKPEVHDAHVVVLSAPGFILGVHGMTMHRVYSEVHPATWHTLTFGSRAYLLRRTHANRFEMESVGGTVLTALNERSFRREAQALSKGEVVDTGLFRASVVRERSPGSPEVLAFEFARPLEDPDVHFVTSTIRGLETYVFPPVGETAVVPLPKIPTR